MLLAPRPRPSGTITGTTVPFLIVLVVAHWMIDWLNVKEHVDIDLLRLANGNCWKSENRTTRKEQDLFLPFRSFPDAPRMHQGILQ
jgi:hypothetical protein